MHCERNEIRIFKFSLSLFDRERLFSLATPSNAGRYESIAWLRICRAERQFRLRLEMFGWSRIRPIKRCL